ncbi:hypothetical protein ACPXB3_19430 [Gordonia sp. DT219]|uniref:hypothetical protein n=1 Tax=Gordonia sp. DT219 TaxID=3416658 RepID=UPI003CE8BBFB
MKNTSKVIGLVLSSVGAVAVIVALVLSFIPWSLSGAAEPTAAFRAQKSLDQTAFQYGSSPGARYTGSLTRKYASGRTLRVDFSDLQVALSGNVDGTIRVNGQQGAYTQIGNYYFTKAPVAFWKTILGSSQQNVDLAPTDNKWASGEWALPNLGYALSPIVLAGRMGNNDLVHPPALGAQLPAPNRDTPDARYWPTSDPVIQQLADNKVKAGAWEITFDAGTKAITHLKGDYKEGDVSTSIDTDVTPMSFDQVSPIFTKQHGLIADLASAPLPGMTMDKQPGLQLDQVGWKQTGDCSNVACGYDITVSGKPYNGSDNKTGHVNYGLTVNFVVNGQPAGALGGTCTPVIRVDFDRTATTRCTATNLGSGGGSIRPNVTFSYLPFLDYGADTLNNYLDDNSEATKRQFTMVRTGTKQPPAATYASEHTGLPSSYAVKRGDYLFDGYGPAGAYLITFAPGYAQHVTGISFDPSWAGTATLRDQMAKQVAAIGDDGRIAYYVAEQSTADALKGLVLQSGQSSKISVYFDPPETGQGS